MCDYNAYLVGINFVFFIYGVVFNLCCFVDIVVVAVVVARLHIDV